MTKKQLRIIVIGAHLDDNEIKTGGIAAKYRALGHVVKYVYATNGNTGHQTMGGGQLARIRSGEAANSCKITGIEPLILDIRNNGLEADIATRELFIRIIREFRPDLIFTHRLNDYHPDHRRTAMLVQDCSYAIRIPNVCPLTPCLDYTPIILYLEDNFKRPYEFIPDVVVDIDDVIDIKMRMLHCHKSQMYEWLPWMSGEMDQVPETDEDRFIWISEKRKVNDRETANRFREELIERYGEEHGRKVEYAEAFEISEYGGKLPKDKIIYYFPF